MSPLGGLSPIAADVPPRQAPPVVPSRESPRPARPGGSAGAISGPPGPTQLGSAPETRPASQALAPRKSPRPARPGGSVGAISGPPQLEVVQEFEAILLGQMLKGLRSTIPEGSDPSPMRDMYQDLFDEHLVQHLARQGGIGLAQAVRAYLEGGSGPGAPLPRGSGGGLR